MLKKNKNVWEFKRLIKNFKKEKPSIMYCRK
jgi:hypothetical protein